MPCTGMVDPSRQPEASRREGWSRRGSAQPLRLDQLVRIFHGTGVTPRLTRWCERSEERGRDSQSASQPVIGGKIAQVAEDPTPVPAVSFSGLQGMAAVAASLSIRVESGNQFTTAPAASIFSRALLVKPSGLDSEA